MRVRQDFQRESRCVAARADECEWTYADAAAARSLMEVERWRWEDWRGLALALALAVRFGRTNRKGAE